MRDTLPEYKRPLMGLASTREPYCEVCGWNRDLEQHHIVWRSWGKVFRDGREVSKPTITLCGRGRLMRSPEGHPYCHGRAHAHMLHFRANGGVRECLETDEPTDYLTALGMEGWRAV